MTRRVSRLALLAVLAVGATGARAEDAEDAALWRSSQPMLRPRLNAALETAPSERPIDWTDTASGISGEIVVHPAIPLEPIPCRSFSYTLRQAGTLRRAGAALAMTGTRCRQAAGLWQPDGTEDRMIPVGRGPLPLAPDAVPDTLVRALQMNLGRLAYFEGPADGIASPALQAALVGFEQDEGVPFDGRPSAAVEALSEAAIARIPPPGACPGTPPPGRSVACGQVR